MKAQNKHGTVWVLFAVLALFTASCTTGFRKNGKGEEGLFVGFEKSIPLGK